MRRVLVAAMLLGLNLPSFATVRINGAGATFPYPIYSKWFSEYGKQNPKIQFNYQAIGSGGGIRQLIKQTVDFGASDAPMKAKDIKKLAWPVIHVPTVLGAVSISYNVKEITAQLKMDGSLVADIFLGKVSKWNDPRIAALNPTVKLPNKNILVVRRSDGSGTTAIFSDFLSQMSPTWKNQVGQGKTLRWPSGIGAKGNAGVAAQIKNNDGAVGYIELAYAIKNKFQVAAIKNPSGKFIAPSVPGVSASATKKYAPGGVSVVNSRNPDAYPISAFTYILLPVKGKENAKIAEVRKFLTWALGKSGQDHASVLYYAPLPKSLARSVLERIDESFK